EHFEVARARCEERLVGQSAERPAEDGTYDGTPRVTPVRVPLAGNRQDRVDDPRSEVAGRVDRVPGGASERKADPEHEQTHQERGDGCAKAVANAACPTPPETDAAKCPTIASTPKTSRNVPMISVSRFCP